jgi:protein involved in polysaccharide export with SLBB domain
MIKNTRLPIINLLSCLLLISFCGIFSPVYTQTLPDYRERTFALSSDSLAALVGNKIEMEATEGSINPDEYIVGPGDKIFISINGIEEIPLDLFINQEGILYIPKVGGIDLNGLSLTSAKEKIKKSINSYYKNVNVFISLNDFRKIKLSLLGDVKKPSTFIMSANSRLIDLIVNSSGLNKTSNFRNIHIIHRDSTEQTYDLLSFLRLGSRDANPLMREGDVVIIDHVDKVVSISGMIKYPGIYEFIEGETIDHLITIAGGLMAKARKDSIEVVSFEKDGKTQVSRYYSSEEISKNGQLLHFEDQVMIRELPNYFDPKFVQIEGYVKYPGYYKINENKTTLSEIINEAGGFRKDASFIDATLTRNSGTVEIDPEYERLKTMLRADMTDDEYDYFKAKSRQRQGKVVVDFDLLFNKGEKSEDVILKRGDVISVPEAKDYVILLGQVVSPGNIVYEPRLTVNDYIQLAGGFGWRAEDGDVRVIKANTGEWLDAEDVDSLKPGDTIWIPETPPGPKFWDVFTASLAVVGQVAAIIAAAAAIIVVTR